MKRGRGRKKAEARMTNDERNPKLEFRSSNSDLGLRTSGFLRHSSFVIRASPFILLLDPPASGAWNMAVDEALLEAAAEGQSTLRFYRWAEPTLSLGYFQTYGDRFQHEASRGCAVVRRPSGGGAILHDRELTYSLAVPEAHPVAATRLRTYRAVHEALIAALGRWGIEAGMLTCATDPRGCGCRRDARTTTGAVPMLPTAVSRRCPGGGRKDRRQRPAAAPGGGPTARQPPVGPIPRRARPGRPQRAYRQALGCRRIRTGPGSRSLPGRSASPGIGRRWRKGSVTGPRPSKAGNMRRRPGPKIAAVCSSGFSRCQIGCRGGRLKPGLRTGTKIAAAA